MHLGQSAHPAYVYCSNSSPSIIVFALSNPFTSCFHVSLLTPLPCMCHPPSTLSLARSACTHIKHLTALPPSPPYDITHVFHAAAGPVPPPPHSAVMHAGLFVCVLCGRTYRSRDSFRHHIETHAGKTTCPHCRQTFATVSSRNRHAAGCSSRPRLPPASPRPDGANWPQVAPEWRQS